MPDPAFIVVAVVVGVAAASYFFSADVLTRRALKRRPVTPIRQLRDGERVRVRGRIVALEEVLTAPLSHRTCVHYLARVDQESANNNWGEIASEQRTVDFILDDGADRLHVKVYGAQVSVATDHRSRSNREKDADATQLEFLHRHGKGTTNFRGNIADTRYTEGVLAPDEEVTALGIVRIQDHEGQRTIVLEAPPDGPMYISDDPQSVQA